LAARPFTWEGRKYVSVEHAYQTNKSGSFDAETYNNKRWKGGVKIRGRKSVNPEISKQLMRDLIEASFRQNPAAKEKLMETYTYEHIIDEQEVTHINPNNPKRTDVWTKAFPEILMNVREQFAEEEVHAIADRMVDIPIDDERVLDIVVEPENPKTPEFNKLPGRSEKLTKTYAGVGARATPTAVQNIMVDIGNWLGAFWGYKLNSGGAAGADSAFENGANAARSNDGPTPDIFKAKDATDQTRKIAKEIHPAPGALSGYVLNLMARNTNQIFGRNLDTPVDFVVLWTPDGAETAAETSRKTGGTGQAIRMASLKGIPVINIQKYVNEKGEVDKDALFNRITEIMEPGGSVSITDNERAALERGEVDATSLTHTYLLERIDKAQRRLTEATRLFNSKRVQELDKRRKPYKDAQKAMNQAKLDVTKAVRAARTEGLTEQQVKDAKNGKTPPRPEPEISGAQTMRDMLPDLVIRDVQTLLEIYRSLMAAQANVNTQTTERGKAEFQKRVDHWNTKRKAQLRKMERGLFLKPGMLKNIEKEVKRYINEGGTGWIPISFAPGPYDGTLVFGEEATQLQEAARDAVKRERALDNKETALEEISDSQWHAERQMKQLNDSKTPQKVKTLIRKDLEETYDFIKLVTRTAKDNGATQEEIDAAIKRGKRKEGFTIIRDDFDDTVDEAVVRTRDSVFGKFADDMKNWGATFRDDPRQAAKMLIWTADGELRSMGRIGTA
jgi:hypothetical protein